MLERHGLRRKDFLVGMVKVRVMRLVEGQGLHQVHQEYLQYGRVTGSHLSWPVVFDRQLHRHQTLGQYHEHHQVLLAGQHHLVEAFVELKRYLVS